MKQVLFATTALIATASVAAADVRLSGYGRFGLDYNSGNSSAASGVLAGVSETNITSRLRIQFDMSAETDGGVAFDARLRLQTESRDGVVDGGSNAGLGLGAGTTAGNGARFGVSYNGIRVNVGNIIGAVENAPGLYTTGTRSAGTGVDGMDFHQVAIKGASWDAYSSGGNGNNGIEALYSAGGFTGHISYTQRNGGAVFGTAGGEDRTGLMLTYSFDDFYVTGAYQASSAAANDDITFVAAGGDFGAFGAKLAYGTTLVADVITLEGNMDIGAASNILVWVNSTDAPTSVSTVDDDGGIDGTAFGINYQYDLGGGSTFVAGYVSEADGGDQFQAGVYFSF